MIISSDLSVSTTVKLPSESILKRKSTIYNSIMNFLQNDVNPCKVGDSFTTRELYGGVNKDWCQNGYPISHFYNERYKDYVKRNWDDPCYYAIQQAGKDVGMCMKYVVAKHPYVFDCKKEFACVRYTRVK